jgi:hypothetical protein
MRKGINRHEAIEYNLNGEEKEFQLTVISPTTLLARSALYL